MMNDMDLSAFYKASDEPDIVIEIDGCHIGLTAQLKIYDIRYIDEHVEENELDDYREQIVHIMYLHRIDDAVTIDELCRVNDQEMGRYITMYVGSDDKLQSAFDTTEGDIEQRFIHAIRQTAKEYSEDTARAFKGTLSSEVWTRQYVAISRYTQGISDILRTYYASMQSVMTPVLDQFANAGRVFNTGIDYGQIFQSISNAFASVINRQPISDLYDNKVRELQGIYRQWGEYGWTIPASAGIQVFSELPIDAVDANRQMAQYSTKEHMHELFAELKGLQHIRKSDLEEAINDYEHGYYKSCAMVVFSMLDGRLIRLQDRNKYRKVNQGAVDKVFNRFKKNDLLGEMLLASLLGANIFAAMSVVFAGGDNFKAQPDIINRNFLDHGMLHRKVRRRDCIQLFLILYNFTRYANEYGNMLEINS